MKRRASDQEELFEMPEVPCELWATLDYPGGSIELEWVRAGTGISEATVRVSLTGSDEVSWEWQPSRQIAW